MTSLPHQPVLLLVEDVLGPRAVGQLSVLDVKVRCGFFIGFLQRKVSKYVKNQFINYIMEFKIINVAPWQG